MKISAPKMLEKVSLAAILHVQNINVLAVLLVIMLWVPQFLSPAEAVFLSIDCGASDSYTDSRSISWVGDDEYVRNGQPQQVQVNVPPVFSTLRVFTVLRKNCYTINSADMIGQRILVRSMFYYGNYDGNNSPPAFDLYLDSTYWTKVTTDATAFVDYEVIYTVSRNTTSICLAQILPGQFPFITSLEFRSLAPTMYSRVGSRYALLLANRMAFGAYQSILRYPDDHYDREWLGARGYGATTQVSGAAEISNIDVSPAPDVPPPAVLQNATTVFNTSQYLQLLTTLPKDEVPVYITTFFSEVNLAALTSPNRRSFQIYVDNKPYSQVIVPPFESVKEVAITNITASSATSLTIQSTSDSTLPVLINAFEVYILRQLATDSTHAGDCTFSIGYSQATEGLAVLQVEFEVLIVWSGDPCIPAGIKPWEWVQCSYTGTIPRIIALNLSGYNLVGLLPDFSSMDALVTIDLHDNTLSGPIPDFLGSLPNLRQLDLSSNRFNGSIPTSLSRNKNLKLVVSDNCLSGMSCPPPPPPPADAPPPPPPSSRPSKKTPPAPYYQTPPSVYYSGDDTSPPPPPGSFLFGSGSTEDSKNSALLSRLLGATIQALFLFL